MKIDKWALWQDRMGRCDLCSAEMPPNDLSVHIHHTLVYKSDLPRSKQQTPNGSINELINLMLVCAYPCHDILQSDRQAGLEFKQAQYGEKAVREYIRKMRPKTGAR